MLPEAHHRNITPALAWRQKRCVDKQSQEDRQLIKVGAHRRKNTACTVV